VGYARYLERAEREDLIATSVQLPAWAQDDVVRFWKLAARYSRCNGKIATELIITLPRTLTIQGQIKYHARFGDLLSRERGGSWTGSTVGESSQACATPA
jgi:hypothetical protein